MCCGRVVERTIITIDERQCFAKWRDEWENIEMELHMELLYESSNFVGILLAEMIVDGVKTFWSGNCVPEDTLQNGPIIWCKPRETLDARCTEPLDVVDMVTLGGHSPALDFFLLE